MAMTTDPTKKCATRNDLMRGVLAELVSLLKQQLADTFDLYSQVKQAHWNVKGPQFVELGQKWWTGHSNRMIKVPASPAGIDALEPFAAENVTDRWNVQPDALAR